MHDTVTILTTIGDYTSATKLVRVDDDGNIIKVPFSGGKKFTYRLENVHDIQSLGELIRSQESKGNEFILRGEPLTNLKSKIVYRRGEGREGGAFKDAGRRWIMIDIDDLSMPEWIDPAIDPDAAAKWARASLPREFRKVTCYYQFSTSQNLPNKLGEKRPHIIKIHLFFWLNKPITSAEWRRYL